MSRRARRNRMYDLTFFRIATVVALALLMFRIYVRLTTLSFSLRTTSHSQMRLNQCPSDPLTELQAIKINNIVKYKYVFRYLT